MVLELDGRPAPEVYLETLGAPKRILWNAGEFHRFGLFPFAGAQPWSWAAAGALRLRTMDRARGAALHRRGAARRTRVGGIWLMSMAPLRQRKGLCAGAWDSWRR